VAHAAQPHAVLGAAGPNSDMARGLRSGVEVLMKPAVGRAIDRPFLPVKLDHRVAAAVLERRRAEILRPEEDIAFRFQSQKHGARPVVMGFVINAHGPLGDMPGENVLSPLFPTFSYREFLGPEPGSDLSSLLLYEKLEFPSRLTRHLITLSARASTLGGI